MRIAALRSLVAAGLVGLCASVAAMPRACLVGVYLSSEATLVAIRKVGDDPVLRYATSTGELGTLSETGAGRYTMERRWDDATATVRVIDRGACQAALRIDGRGMKGVWKRVPIRTIPVEFVSRDTRLAGQLLLPPHRTRSMPLVVNVHGSEKTAAIDGSTFPLLAAGAGIAAFVYDKRGTGASQGVYTQDFELLAADAAAAVQAARKAAGPRIGRVGLAGFSQGGWVAPSAAIDAKADFVVVGYGVVGTPVEQDVWQVDDELARAGFGAADRDAIHEVTAATGRVAESDFKSGLDAVDALKAKYRDRPWLARIAGQYSGLVLQGKLAQAIDESPSVPWRYDSLAVLRRLDVPQLWVLGGEDSVAPSAITRERLTELQRAGKPIDIVVFPHADHGIIEYRIAAQPKAGGVRAAPGYWPLLMDWINGRRKARYGDALITAHPSRRGP